MSTLVEQIDAAVKLFAGLEKRVSDLESIVGKKAIAGGAKVSQPTKTKARGKILNGDQGKQLRRQIVAFLFTQSAPVRTGKIYRAVDVRSMQALMWHLHILKREGLVTKPNRVTWAARKLPAVAGAA